MGTHTNQLTGRERIALAFEHRPADRLPVFDVVNNPSIFIKCRKLHVLHSVFVVLM